MWAVTCSGMSVMWTNDVFASGVGVYVPRIVPLGIRLSVGYGFNNL